MKIEAFLRLLREIPILGGLVDCSGADYWDSLGQTTTLFVLSTMPIWLGTLIVYATGDNVGRAAFMMAFYSTVAHGELFMYATALLAPIFWIALSDPPGARNFPGKVSHIVFIVIISVIAAVFFGLLTAGNKLNQSFTFKLSVSMFFVSVILLYLGILYHESRLPDPAATMQRGEQEFAAGYREHRNEP